LDAPWSMAVTENGTVLVSERNTEKILQVDAGETTEITTVPGVDARGEGGLLGIVVNGGDLYAYTTTATDNRVLTLSLDDPDQAPETVIDGLPKGTNHN
ncbi:MAG TPA: glucose dehydrogenase, partial [Corynebacterium variabile]|nr:glucose dehydrogenase [Corynebacterium variabile]